MQRNRASRRPIIEIDINEVVQGSDNLPTIKCQDQSATTRVTRPVRCQTRDISHRAGVTQPARVSIRITQPTSCWDRITRPWVTRPARCQAEDKSHRARPGSLNPHASQQGSLDPPVTGTGSLDPGSLDQRVASPRTNGSSVSFLPQALEAAGVAEYIVLAEAVAQDGTDPAGPEGQHFQ